MLLNPTAFSSSATTTTPPLFHHHHHHHHHLHLLHHHHLHHLHLHLHLHKSSIRTTTRRALHNFRVSLSPNNPHQTPPPVITTSSSSSSSSLVLHINSASEVVRNFYSGINARDLASVQNLIAVNCVYEDLIFPHPFTGRKEILEFFHKFIDTISADLQFVIDDISNEDNSAVGVTWHLEWKGKPFPFSKGCSFYRLEVVNGKRQIIYGRDSVEPSIKPGETALVAIRGVTWLLQQFPQLADLL